jgi:multidrug transporter EmrE-like cation transporter
MTSNPHLYLCLLVDIVAEVIGTTAMKFSVP